jgi:hypothetical protein
LEGCMKEDLVVAKYFSWVEADDTSSKPKPKTCDCESIFRLLVLAVTKDFSTLKSNKG